MDIPLFLTSDALDRLHDETAERLARVARSGRYILGPELEAFEAELAAHLGVAHCVGVANGTDAITVALRALGVGRGDEVVVPASTFYATPEAVVNAGATPVFCDVDPESWVMTAATAEPVISERTAALLPVHLFGNPAPMDELRELAAARGLHVVEDAAQAAGARLGGRCAGALGDAATMSFFPSKNLGAMGDAGAILTDDGAVADLARELRFHGSQDKVVHDRVGYNSRLDEIQAAVLRVRLPHLDDWTAARRAAADAYRQAGIAELATPQAETAGGESCFHLYVVMVPGRDGVRERLADSGVQSRAYYTVPMHRQPAMAAFASDASLPAAERLAAEGLALPMGQSMSAEQAGAVCEALRGAVRA